MIGGSTGPICSRAGCDAPAAFRIEWRNPRIHADDRVKVWLACADHVDVLSEFLLARSFPVTAVPFADEEVRT